MKTWFSINPVFVFFTFDGSFEAWEHQNRTRHEKIPPGSYLKACASAADPSYEFISFLLAVFVELVSMC